MKDLFNMILLDAYANKLDKKNSFWEKLKGIIWLYRNSASFACVFWFRVNHFWRNKRLSVRRIYKFGNDISEHAQIGSGLRLTHIHGIVIGRRVVMGKNCTLANGVTLGEKSILEQGMPKIGDNVYIGTGAKLLGKIEIGDNVIIGALTFSDKSIPPNSTAYGNPINIKEEN